MKLLFSYRRRLLAATALLSLSLIAYQVAIMQLLSLSQWYHYANMVISIALLGFGTAGTVLSLARNWCLRHSETMLPLLMILAGLSMLAATWLTQYPFAQFDSYLLFVDKQQWLALMINYVLFLLPYFFGGLALGIIFVKHVDEIGRFYFSDLTGSAAGAMLSAVLAWHFLPSTLPAIHALIVSAAGFILLPAKGQWISKGIGVVTFLLSIYSVTRPIDLKISQYKSLSRTLHLPSASITEQEPGPYGFVQVISADALRYAPGLSLSFTGDIPIRKAVFNNGDWFGPIVNWKKQDTSHLLDYTTMGLPYALGEKDKVLILHGGTGMHVSHALHHRTAQIDVIEPHRGIADMLLHQLADDNDSLFFHKEVHFHIIEPRTFLSVSKQKYDLVELPVIGSFGGNSGLNAMREEYSLTKEAIADMWKLLDEDGMISMSCWIDYPFRNPLKIVATLSEVMEESGIPKSGLHLTAIRSWGTVTFLLKKTPFTNKEMDLLRRFCDQNYFDPLFLPGLHSEDRSFYNGINDLSFFRYMDELIRPSREKIYREYDFYLRPATDDNPYFSQFVRWKSLPHLAKIFGTQSVSFLELGWMISVITFIQIGLMAVVLIILPLFKIGWSGGSRRWTILYFSGLGIGYMFLEMVFIQKFILFFGNPVYTVSFVVSVMLLSSGVGSFFSSGFMAGRLLIQRVLVAIFMILLCYTLFLSGFLGNIVGFPMALKTGISVLIISVPAFLMGMPFPLGLKALSVTGEKNIPWAWGINGCMSVIGASLSSLVAVEAGFTTVMTIAVAAYGVSLLSCNLK